VDSFVVAPHILSTKVGMTN